MAAPAFNTYHLTIKRGEYHEKGNLENDHQHADFHSYGRGHHAGPDIVRALTR